MFRCNFCFYSRPDLKNDDSELEYLLVPQKDEEAEQKREEQGSDFRAKQQAYLKAKKAFEAVKENKNNDLATPAALRKDYLIKTDEAWRAAIKLYNRAVPETREEQLSWKALYKR